jgi:hypothetical protein
VIQGWIRKALHDGKEQGKREWMRQGNSMMDEKKYFQMNEKKESAKLDEKQVNLEWMKKWISEDG